MLTLHYGPAFCDVELDDPFLLRSLEQHLTIENPDYRGGEDSDEEQEVIFLDTTRDDGVKLMTGLVPAVQAWAESNGIDVTLEGWPYDLALEPVPEIDSKIVPGITLRDYQLETAQKIVQGYRGVVELATGGGKTEIAIAVIYHLGTPRTIFVVPAQSAMHDMYARFVDRGLENVGRLGDGYEEIDAQVVIAVVNSLYSGVKRGNWEVMQLLEECELLFEDEVHHKATAFTWKVVAANCGAHRRIGLSGTPYKDDASRFNPQRLHHHDSWLTGYIGPTLVYISPKELQGRGMLAPIKIVSFPTYGKNIHYLRSWDKVYREGIVDNAVRTSQIATIALNLADMGRYPIISVERLDHGRIFQRLLARDGVPAACMFGDGVIYVPREFAEAEGLDHEPAPLYEWRKKPPKKRGRKPTREKVVIGHEEDFVQVSEEIDVKEYFRQRKLKVLIGSRPFDEFLDIPCLTDMINAAGYKARQRFRQKMGRILRNSKGTQKTVAWMWDPWDNCHYFLRNHSQQRLEIAEAEGFPVERDWMFSYPFYAYRFRDCIEGHITVKLDKIHVRVDMTIPVGTNQQFVYVKPAIELEATVEEGDDLQECADLLHRQAVGLFYRETFRQAAACGDICANGFQQSAEKYLSSLQALEGS